MNEALEIAEGACQVCKRDIVHKRLTTKYLINDALKNMFNLERGLLFTFLGIIKNPQAVVGGFVEGDRYRYMNPFRFLLLAATVGAIVAANTEFSLGTYMNFQTDNEEVMTKYIDFVRQYMNIIILVNVPFFALGSFLAFRHAKWNYAEHLVLNAYAYSAVVFIDVPFDLLFSFMPSKIDAAWDAFSQVLILGIGYVYVRTLSNKILPGILRSIWAFLLANFILGFIVAAGVVSYIIITKG